MRRKFWDFRLMINGEGHMDMSGIGMMLVSCCFMAVSPVLIAGVFYLPLSVYIEKKATNPKSSTLFVLFIVLYIISFIISCVWIYYNYLQYMYVM